VGYIYQVLVSLYWIIALVDFDKNAKGVPRGCSLLETVLHTKVSPPPVFAVNGSPEVVAISDDSGGRGHIFPHDSEDEDEDEIGPHTHPFFVYENSFRLHDVRQNMFNFDYGRRDLSPEDLTYVSNQYTSWAKEPISILYGHKDNPMSCEYRRVAKRGNSIYRRMINQRVDIVFQKLSELGVEKYLVRQDGHRFLSNSFLISLTYDTKARFGTPTRRYDAWNELSNKLNIFLTCLRHRYNINFLYRVFESTQNGYPHVHLLVIFDTALEVVRHKDSWRLSRSVLRDIKKDISSIWSLGYIDIRAVYSLAGLDVYLRKDLDKQLRLKCKQAVLSCALNWLFRKRSFSISVSGKFVDSINTSVIQIEPAIQQLTEAKKDGLIYYGIVKLTKIDGSDPPDSVSFVPDEAVLREIVRCIKKPSPAFSQLIYNTLGYWPDFTDKTVLVNNVR